MKTDFSITVKKPCLEKFEAFKKTTNGGFCDSCEKEVIDFTTMDQTALVQFFTTKNSKTCGRFKASQLHAFNHPIAANNTSGFLSRSIGILSFSLLALCASTTTAQETSLFTTAVQTEVNTSIPSSNTNLVLNEEYTIKGTVLDEQDLPLAGVNVVLKGTAIGVVTDFDGRFEFSQALQTDDVLVFSYLGYDTKEYVVSKSTSKALDITITFDASDIELMGEVDIEGPYKSKRTIIQKFGDFFN